MNRIVIFLICLIVLFFQISCKKSSIKIYVDISYSQLNEIKTVGDPDWENFKDFFSKIKGQYKITKLWIRNGKPIIIQLDPAAVISSAAFKNLVKVSSLKEVYYLNLDHIDDYKRIAKEEKNNKAVYFCIGGPNVLNKPFVKNWSVEKLLKVKDY